MQKNKSKIIIILGVILGFLFILGVSNKDNFKKNVKNIVPQSIMSLAKELILFYNHKIKRNLLLIRNEKIEFITISDKKYSLTKFQNKLFKTNGPKSYIAIHDNHLFLITGTGILFSTDLNKFDNKSLKLSNVRNNLNELFGYKYMSKNSYFVTGIHIHKNEIYLSFTKEVNKNCFNTSVIKAKINITRMLFEEFFTPNECINTVNDYGEFNLGNAGGALSNFVDNKILLSIGDYGYRTHAQNKKNIFGKILSIDLDSKKKKIVSLGHRNVQGLNYDYENNLILSSEHGPQGGDEININKYNINSIKNFGWPVSSYGEHYGGKNDPKNKKKYVSAPLNKSHEKFGFNEPFKNFTPSIAPSRILFLDKDFINNKNKQIFLSTLGYPSKIKQGHMSIHYIVFNNKLKITNHQIYPINERTRDMIYSKKYNKVFFFFESSGSIGILEQNK